MRFAAWLLVAACAEPLGGGTDSGPDVFERDCVETVNAGPIAWIGPPALMVTSSCSSTTSRIEMVMLYDGTFSSASSVPIEYHARSTRLVDLNGSGPVESLFLRDNGFGYSVWLSGPMSFPTNIDYARRLDDLTTEYVDGDARPDVLVAGDGAIRITIGADPLATSVAAGDEVELLSGQAFAVVAAQRLPGKPAPEIYYIARGEPGMPHELGVARSLTTSPLGYSIATHDSIASGPILPLVIADVDGDGIGDVIGATDQVFVRSSKTGAVATLAEGALAIDAGDIDADGLAEPIFLSRDGTAVRRVHVATDGSLTAETVIDTMARTLTVDDLDADGRADIAVVEGKLGYAGTRVLIYR